MVMGNCLGCGGWVPVPRCFCGHQPCDRSLGLVLYPGLVPNAQCCSIPPRSIQFSLSAEGRNREAAPEMLLGGSGGDAALLRGRFPSACP